MPSPFYHVFGYLPKVEEYLPCDLHLEEFDRSGDLSFIESYRKHILEFRNEKREKVREKASLETDYCQLPIGQRVMLQLPSPKKLEGKYEGPFEVIAKFYGNTYVLSNQNGKKKIAHIERIKKISS